MKKFIVLMFALTFAIVSAVNAAVLWTENFDDASGFTVTAGGMGEDGIYDYWLITDGSNISKAYTGVSGNFMAGLDMDDTGINPSAAVPGIVEWTGIDIATKANLEFVGLFGEDYDAPGDIDDLDYLLVEYQIDAGGWNNLLAFNNDGVLYNTFFYEDTDFDGIGDGAKLTNTMTSFTKTITGTGNLLDLRFSASVNSGDEDFAADTFQITGIPEPATFGLIGLALLFFRRK